jgi:5,10-methylenetetrahydrofolate reductase
MRFCEIIESDEFVITAELRPPKGIDLEKFFAKADLMQDLVSAMNVTDGCRAQMHVSPLAAAHLLREKGHEVIFQITCRDRNRIAIQSDLLGAFALGIENVLVLGGDHPLLGDHPEAQAVYDLDTVQALRAAKVLESGVDLSGKPLRGTPQFCMGAVANPNCEPAELQLIMMTKKAQEGIKFFQTQPIFEPGVYRQFHSDAASLGVKIITGVLVLKSAKQATRLNNVPGIRIPQAFIERLEHASDPEEEGIRIARELIESLRNFSDGVHIMAPGRERLIPQILES